MNATLSSFFAAVGCIALLSPALVACSSDGENSAPDVTFRNQRTGENEVLSASGALARAAEVVGFTPHVFVEGSIAPFTLSAILIPQSPPTSGAVLHRVGLRYSHPSNGGAAISVDAFDHRDAGAADVGELPQTASVGSEETEVQFRASDSSSQALYVFQDDSVVYIVTVEGTADRPAPDAMLAAIEQMINE